MNSSISTIVMFVVLFGLMYFMMIRPQKKQQQQHQEMMNALKPGDEIVTIGGLHGVVSEVNADKNIVTIDCDGVYLDFTRSAIARVLKKAAETTATATTTEDKNDSVVVDETKEDK
ncbi:preprotein translocase subunit YajC [Ligilactobacillus murinus]|uniref:preprotein translocase subunit YajC n=1 Tax=Ligilactobacillus murinus TaxID=1622 RepID=UPI000E8E072D|nr:preprotein translocase subunit YajC [Ligilactobacillus murinus]BDI02326.1 preprotein translocase subunit YajC [Ligilactobacillus murinus]GFI63693.1 Sec translocon accessory complex subunit YajC [Lactobacillaceae bacterium]HBV48678.1 preprotein translocase subunit YajC [Lactobacillus sp.]